MENKTVFFLHIPRTGGTTVNTALRDIYGEDNSFFIYSDDEERKFKELPYEKKVNLKFISAHRSFLFKDNIPAINKIFTFVRNPVERVLSHYNSVCKVLFARGQKEFPSLDKFILGSRSFECDNDQVRQISGIGADITKGQVKEKHLFEAKNNIEKYFCFVGIMEKFVLSVLSLQSILQVEDIYYMPQADVARLPETDKLDDSLYESIVSLNLFDFKLYEWLNKRFNFFCNDNALRNKAFIYNLYVLLIKTEHPAVLSDELNSIKDAYYKKDYCLLRILMDNFIKGYPIEKNIFSVAQLYNAACFLKYVKAYEKAIAGYENILKTKNEYYIRALFHLAEMEYKQGNFKEARKKLKFILQECPCHWKAWVYLTRILH